MNGMSSIKLDGSVLHVQP